jgi:hypothetical protein
MMSYARLTSIAWGSEKRVDLTTNCYRCSFAYVFDSCSPTEWVRTSRRQQQQPNQSQQGIQQKTRETELAEGS